jgi:IrrE N-terminal-like domain
MKWYPDPTNRFPQRPYYEGEELDRACETIIVDFLRARNGTVVYPIATNDLEALLDRETADLDVYSDLSADGPTVEGKTIFSPRGKPSVRILAELQEPHREHRLRTTLAHELGHVKFHNYLYGLYSGAPSPCCTNEAIIDAAPTDWLEWQAGYCSGAFLIPLRPLRSTIREAKRAAGIAGEPRAADPVGQELIRAVQTSYRVSSAAARVRLLQLGFLSE